MYRWSRYYYYFCSYKCIICAMNKAFVFITVLFVLAAKRQFMPSHKRISRSGQRSWLDLRVPNNWIGIQNMKVLNSSVMGFSIDWKQPGTGYGRSCYGLIAYGIPWNICLEKANKVGKHVEMPTQSVSCGNGDELTKETMVTAALSRAREKLGGKMSIYLSGKICKRKENAGKWRAQWDQWARAKLKSS